MVRKCHYRDRESGINFFDVKTSRLKHLFYGENFIYAEYQKLVAHADQQQKRYPNRSLHGAFFLETIAMD